MTMYHSTQTKSRFQQEGTICNHRGTESPMPVVEPAILEIAIQRGKMNQPLIVAKGLLLAKSMIKPGSKLEKDVIQYLKNWGQYSTKSSSTKVQGSSLGAGYWVGFQKRHAD